jgi:hypothetical protein
MEAEKVVGLSGLAKGKIVVAGLTPIVDQQLTCLSHAERLRPDWQTNESRTPGHRNDRDQIYVASTV